MNDIQKKILNIIQTQFPIDPRPYARVSEGLHSSEAIVLDEVGKMKQAGIIRRIGANFNPAALGYISTLAGASVPCNLLDEFVAEVNGLAGVSHNYGRRHRVNVWFTLTMKQQESIERTIDDLRRKYSLPFLHSFPAEEIFKLQVNFDFSGNRQEVSRHPTGDSRQYTNPHNFSEANVLAEPSGRDGLFSRQIALVRRLQEDLPVVSESFNDMSERIAIPVTSILQQIREWKATGLIRRFGASIHHRQAGFTCNAMVVLAVEAQQIEPAGRFLSGFRQVSHCYQRRTIPEWPFQLYAMAHCHSKAELDKLIQQMVEEIHPLRHDVLLSVSEYKKNNIKYFTE